MGVEDFLEKRLRELERERESTISALATIREKIQAADAKRSSQMDEEFYHKWSEILRGLESQLDKAKRELTSIEAELEEKREKLTERHHQRAAMEAARLRRIEELKNMPPEEFVSLSLEDMQLLHEIELSEGTAVEAGMSDTGSFRAPEVAAVVNPPTASTGSTPRPEAAHSPGAGSVTMAPPPDQPSQGPLQPHVPTEPYLSAIDKLASGATEQLTVHEFESLITFYRALDKLNLADEPQKRLKVACAVAIRKADEEWCRIRVRAASLLLSEPNRAV